VNSASGWSDTDGVGDATIHPMTAADWPQVRRIYAEGIASGEATFETAVPDWEYWDSSHLPHSRLVAHAGGAAAGWAALSPVSKRAVYRGVAEVSVYIGAEHRGRGIGTQLLAALIAESERNGIWTMQSSIFPENEASARLQRRFGFRVVGRRERIARRDGRWRDTLVLERRSTVAGTD
jgi:L-amino acid N-acyltransferase YncA